MLLDRIAVDQGSVGAAEVFHERVVQDRDDYGVLAADRQIVDLDVVVRLAADRGALLGERDLLEHQTIHAEYQFRHRRPLPSILTRQKLCPSRRVGRDIPAGPARV